ncbi:molybdopterin-guanine dinucleotide biosynthesis protein A [Cryobacterium sp. MP_M5]|uniref:molybdenum cofactor guanylyltransferase n=1 Tax=unclassified Cryobacterium TaxID=2649013 RepID=UPI0018CA436F|nr:MULTISPECIES: NTP transferase domain-containing protein [unclassified Cryobacterium]MBG6059871.1 molybdopterin-guanine dinucleotide biosynthesis protein A [Cryobacterium sp. MP_M3]MEC5178319.1 molybdopterin-guanine dinucleotide biosynthesis protein A [Cryobacterium sp. MP_M5]
MPSPASQPENAAPAVDLIVLAGGRGSRLGGAFKPAVEVAGRTLLARVLDARGLARRVVVVGPDAARDAAGPQPAPLIWALEDPPFGGPVAGIVAGLAALERAEPDPHSAGSAWLLVLACDLPWAADAARLLVAAVTDPASGAAHPDGFHLVDADGREQWLAGIYRGEALRDSMRRLGSEARGASMRQLLSGFSLRGIRDPGQAGRDVDTWQDVRESTALLNPSRSNPPRSFIP